MALPLIGLAAAGAAKGILGARAQSKATENAWRQAEDQRKRMQKQFEMSGIRGEHSAEARKTMGNIWGRGMLSNFGVDPQTGQARNPQFAALLADPWQYRSREQLLRMSPHRDPIAKPSGPGFGGYLGAGLGGALGGAADYVAAGGEIPGMTDPAGGTTSPTAATSFGPTQVPPSVPVFNYSPVQLPGSRITAPRIY